MRFLPSIVVLLGLHVVFFADVLVGDRTLSPAGYTSGLTPTGPYGAPASALPPHVLDVEGAAWVDEPGPYVAARGWQAGELPLWNANEGLGMPLAANLNSGAGNPLQVALALRPSARATDLFALARLLLLGAGTVWYLGLLTLAPIAALTGAAIVAYGGYATAWIVHHPLSAEVFLPLMLGGIERGRAGARAGWLVLALAVAGSSLGGKLQATLLCLVLAGAYALVRAPRRRGGAGVATVAATLVTIASGVALAAYLLVPAAELLARASGLTLGGRSALAAFTTPFPTLAAVALPRAFVPPGRIFADGLPLPPGIGVVATVLAVIGASAARSPLHGIARFFALWAALLLLRNVGVFGRAWMAALPVVGGIFFLKYAFTAAFALAVVAAIGVDAIARALVSRRTALVTIAATTVVLALLVTAAGRLRVLAGWPGGVVASAAPLAVALVALAAGRRLGGAVTAAVIAVAAVLELRLLAPATHPPQVDPYRPPPYVEFLRDAAPGRVLAADVLMPPLTSAAAGLRDLRSIDVLTPNASYLFFTRLVSFCARIIHFTVDPDLPLAATAPAIDLAGVRWVVSRGPFRLEDLDARVARQVGHERVARLLGGLRGIRTEGHDLALGTIEVGGAPRFAVSLFAPSVLVVDAESEAPELAWDAHVDGDAARISWSVDVDGPRGASGVAQQRRVETVDGGGSWAPTRVRLGDAATRRRVRLRIRVESAGRARIDLGDLGFSDGADAEASRRAGAIVRHRAELATLAPVFRDDAVGAVVYENRNALPRAFRVARFDRVASAEAALTRIADGLDFRAEALVTAGDARMNEAERVAAIVARRAGGDGAAPRAWDDTIIVKDDPAAVTIATTGAHAALVVLSDLDFPGWHARIDGVDAPVLATDGVLRGVLVPAGAHCVELRYGPASWWWGALGTVLAALVLPAVTARAARRHRQTVPLVGAMV